MAGLANASTMGLTSRRGHGGRCGGGGVRSGRRRWSPWGLAGGLLRAGYRLRPAQPLRAKSVAQGGRCPGVRPKYLFEPPESPGEPLSAFSMLKKLGPGVIFGLKTAHRAPERAGSFSREGVAFRAGLAQVQLARLRLAEPDNVFGDRPEEPVFWAWAILTPIYQRLRRARRMLSLRTGQDERMDRIRCSGIQEPQGLTD